MRLTIRSNLAIRTLMFCAENHERLVRKHEVAKVCNASENHLAQVVNTLAQMGTIHTYRGRAGGMGLAHAPEDISIGAVLRAFEGSLPFAECFDPAATPCALAGACLFRQALADAVEAFYLSMDRWTLADLVTGNAAVNQLLHPAPAATPACTGRHTELQPA